MMSLSASMTNTAPITGSTSHWPVINATTARLDPSASAPVSPMITIAGCALYQRKPRFAPAMMNANAATNCWPWMNAMTPYAMNASSVVPPASASSPSLIATAVVVPTITATAIGTYQSPSSYFPCQGTLID